MMKHGKRIAIYLSPALALAIATSAAGVPSFGGWSAVERIDSLPASSAALSTPAVEGCVSWAKNGLDLYFTSNRTGDFDLYKATRPSRDTGFSHVVRLPAPVNKVGSNESCPTIANGNRLYFTGTHEDPAGDLYVSRRTPTGWTEPENLGPNINSDGLEESATFFEDGEGRRVMLFNRRPNTETGPSLVESVILQSIEGGLAVPLAGAVNAIGANARPTLSRNGRTLWFDSNRSGLGGPDIFVASRASVSQPFGNVTHVPELSSPAFDARPSPSFDDSMIAMSSNRAGSASPAPDIWIASRERAKGAAK